MTWRRDDAAPPWVNRLAKYLAPKWGSPCTQVGMAVTGDRYAFVFENSQPEHGIPRFWWIELPPTPDDVQTSPALKRIRHTVDPE